MQSPALALPSGCLSAACVRLRFRAAPGVASVAGPAGSGDWITATVPALHWQARGRTPQGLAAGTRQCVRRVGRVETTGGGASRCDDTGMATIDTFAALLENEHGLDAFCPTCQRWASVNLHELVAVGRGQETFIGRRPRCRECGTQGYWQVRPPTMRGTAAPTAEPVQP